MINLIKNEYIKIFHKKGIYIVALILVGFAILTNLIYKNMDPYSMFGGYYYQSSNSLKSELDGMTPSDENYEHYISFKNEYDLSVIADKYERDSWQRNTAYDKFFSVVNNINSYTYGPNKDNKLKLEEQKKLDTLIEKFDNDDWRYFVKEEIKDNQKYLNSLKEQQKNTTNKKELAEIKRNIDNNSKKIELLNVRLEKNISYATSYLNTAIEEYYNSYVNLADMKIDDNKYSSKLDYNDFVSRLNINKYIIDNEIDNNNMASNRAIVKNLFNEYSLFILIIVIMIAGTTVSEEFSRGTVKLLLTRPYSRTKILLSKFITALSIIPIAIIFTLIVQLLVGGFFFGFDSLSIPVLAYNFNTNLVESYNVFHYLLITTLANLPILILLATLAFAISVIFTNSTLAVVLSFVGFMGGNIINQLAIMQNVKFLRYFVTLNWDFNQYLFGGLPRFEYTSFGFSAIICVIYFIILLIPTFIVFKKKNIKNI